MAQKLPTVYDIAKFTQFYGNIMPPRMGNKGPALNLSFLKTLRVMDEQDHVNKGKWYHLPISLSQQLIERITYYKGRAMFFYWQDKFWMLPFSPCGPMDCYGRWTKLTPLPFNGSAETDGVKPLLEGLEFEVVYEPIMPQDLKLSDLTTKCVILNDYTPQISQSIQPRAQLQEPLLQVMSECLPFMRTALINSTGVAGIRINETDESASVEAASQAALNAALNGDKWIPMTASLGVEQLSYTAPQRSEDYLLALQSMDNIRLSAHGITNGGIFEKKAHLLETEAQMGNTDVGLVMQDNISCRQEFCTIVNSIWPLGIWYEASETTANLDKNGDGMIADSKRDTYSYEEKVAAASNAQEVEQ